MNKEPNEKNGAEDVYPDISAIFNVDERRAAGKPVEKTTDTPKKGERILTAPEGAKHLPKAERKKVKKDERRAKRTVRVKKAKTRAIIILSVVLVAVIVALAVWWRIMDARKPVVSVARATVETVERSYSDKGVILLENNRLTAVLIDNDYDVHYIAKKCRAELTTADGRTAAGEVSAIKEERPDSELFAGLTATLLGETPEVPVYAVHIVVDDAENVLKNGDRVTVRVITETAENAVAVPSSAILMDGNQPYVWIFHPFTKKLTRQDVAVGIASEDMTEVLRGLKKGARVIAGASVTSSELFEGIRVKTKQQP